MALRFVPKGKKKKNHLANSLCQIVVLDQSPPQGKQAEAQCMGSKIDSREIRKDPKQKDIFA